MSHPLSSISDVPIRPGDVLADKYRVDRILGMGGMGVVVAAQNLALGKRVAIKMMLPNTLAAPRAIERFEREARSLVQLKSEHVSEVLDVGKLTNGAPYIVMELLEGSDFEHLLRGRTFLVEQAVDYVLQVCEAVAEAHSLGIVHRDLKPRNLFLTHRRSGAPLVKVLDFGISKWNETDAESHSLTRTSDIIGSPNYMSPEQIRSAKDVDARTDIWSLGVILFELLTGRVPFVAESLPQLCALILEQDAPLVSSLRADVPAALVPIVARCLERRPEKRFQTIVELAVALQPFAPALSREEAPAQIIAALSRPAASGFSPPAARRSAPLASSSARVHVGGGTSISWAETILEGIRSRRRVLWPLAALPILVLTAVGLVWGRLHGAPDGANRGASAVEPTPSRSLPTVPSHDALPLHEQASPSYAPSSSSSSHREPPNGPQPTVSAAPRSIVRRPAASTVVIPIPATQASPRLSATTPARTAPVPPPTDDLLTPADRK